MSAPDRRREIEALSADRPLLPFLPLVYVAWADGELSHSERASIVRRVEEQGGLDADCRERLARWLDPAAPPSARELQAILRTVRAVARGLPADARGSLAELGAEMARVGSGAAQGEPVTPAERQALEALEGALGVAGAEAARELLAGRRPQPAAAAAERAFEPAALQAVLDAPYGGVRDRLKAVLTRRDLAYRPELPRAEYREQVLDWTRTLAAEGFGSLPLPARYGGGDDLGGFIAAFETLAFHDPSLLVKFGVQFGLFAGSIQQLGTERHHRAWLAAAARLELPGCFAMTETGHGSNVAELGTVARWDQKSGGFVLHTPTPADRKDYIGNAACHARLATVFAQLEIGAESHGVHALVVPIRDEGGRPLPGVAIEDCGLKEGLNGVDNGRIAFDNVPVPRENLLDRFARVAPDGSYSSPIASPAKRFFTMLGTLVGGRISVAAAALSASKSGLAIALRYAVRRRQFGPAGRAETVLLDYLAHQRRLLPRLAATYALDFAHKELVRRYLAADDDGRRAVETLAAGLKAYGSWHNLATLQECREACGGQGYLAENRLPGLRADTDVFATFEGDNTVLMQLVARGRLTDYRHQFSDLRFSSLLDYLGRRAATAVTELNPVIIRSTGEEHLLDPDFHHAALAYREERLLRSAAGRLKSRIDAGMDTFEAFNECQDHLLAMAHAWVERVVLESFQAAVRELRGEPFGAALKRLAALFALWRIEQDRGWFLESGYLEGAKARAVRALVNRLCAEVRDEALELVEAWGIPPALLAAPIAADGERP